LCHIETDYSGTLLNVIFYATGMRIRRAPIASG
jgi:hypothetical protein